MLGMVSVLDRKKHSFIGGELGAWIERLANDSNRRLCLIRYNELGVFCICEFVSPARDVFVDVMNLGNSLGNFTYKKACELRQRLFAPVTTSKTSRMLSEAESDYYHSRMDDDAEETERCEKRRMGE